MRINSSNNKMQQAEIFCVLVRLLEIRNNIDAVEATFYIGTLHEVVIVRITSINDESCVKKMNF